jgi:hypothetical protein
MGSQEAGLLADESTRFDRKPAERRKSEAEASTALSFVCGEIGRWHSCQLGEQRWSRMGLVGAVLRFGCADERNYFSAPLWQVAVAMRNCRLPRMGTQVAAVDNHVRRFKGRKTP